MFFLGVPLCTVFSMAVMSVMTHIQARHTSVDIVPL